MILNEHLESGLLGLLNGVPHADGYNGDCLGHLLPLVATSGIRSTCHGSESIEERCRDLRNWSQFVTNNATPNAIFMDTTTLYTAWSVLHGKGNAKSSKPDISNSRSEKRGRRRRVLLDTSSPKCFLSANTLLDLENFIRSVVLYDQIFCLSGGESVGREMALNFNETLGEPIIIDIPVPDIDTIPLGPGGKGGVGGALNDLIETVSFEYDNLISSKSNTACGNDRDAITNSWKALLGRSDLLQSHLSAYIARPGSAKWASYGPALLEALIDKIRDPLLKIGIPALAEYIGECNVRSLFNTRVSQILGLSYSPNIMRVPFRHYGLSNAVAAQRIFEDIDFVQRILNEQRTKYLHPKPLQVPVFLTVILNRISQLNEFSEELARLRFDAIQYRERRKEVLDAIRNGNLKILKGLRAALEEDTKQWTNVLKATTVMGVHGALMSALGGGIASWVIGALGILQVYEQIDQETRDSMKRTFFRPSEFFFTKIGESCTELMNAGAKIEKLWGIGPEQMSRITNDLNRIALFDEQQSSMDMIKIG